MYALRKWSVNHVRSLNGLYQKLENVFSAFHPILNKIGYDRVEKPVAFIEKNVKGLLFDCQMCGHCVLHDTGMSCPMNCPKELRNGPCGGVRPNGNCEVKPEMLCVWVEAWRGSKIMNDDNTSVSENDSILDVQPAIDYRLKGHSSWLREIRLKHDQQAINKGSH